MLASATVPATDSYHATIWHFQQDEYSRQERYAGGAANSIRPCLVGWAVVLEKAGDKVEEMAVSWEEVS